MAHTRQPHPLPQPVFGEPVFSEGTVLGDPTGFSTTHPSDNDQYKQLGDLLKKDVVSFEKSRVSNSDLYTLESAYGPHGPAVTDKIKTARQISFHAVGDTGASAPRKYRSELHVFDQLAKDASSAKPGDQPAFLFHLGDVVYSFGESRYYYDQFYEPLRNYPAPVFAIAGNHDSFLIPGTADKDAPLTTFQRNFCSEKSVIMPEAGSLHRTAMTQPGLYFALDAPFVRIIALFSNALEDPGLISSQGGHWRGVPDVQLDFLGAQLDKIAAEKYAGAVLIAVHHPPFTYAPPSHGTRPSAGGNHGSSTDMLRDIDTVCKAKGVYPHAFLCAHAHNYQRYTRTVRLGSKDLDVPFVVCGSGGHNINPIVASRRGQPAQEPDFGTDVKYLDVKPAVDTSGLLLEKYDDRNYGYLRITVDAQQLRIAFNHVLAADSNQSRFDLVTVDLASHTMAAN
jgi:hypothetical protein